MSDNNDGQVGKNGSSVRFINARYGSEKELLKAKKEGRLVAPESVKIAVDGWGSDQFLERDVCENPVRSQTMPLSKQTLIGRREQQGKRVNGAIPVKLQCKQVQGRMAPVPVVLTASLVTRVPLRVLQELVLKVAAVQTVRTATLWSGQWIPQFHGTHYRRKVGEAVRAVKVVQEGSLL